jgi:xanthine dehydrogenase accessory factor
MSHQRLPDVLDSAIRAQKAGEGLAIATVIRSAAEGAEPGDRMLIWSERSEGYIEARLDEAIRSEGRAALETGRSGVRSFALETGKAVGMQGGDVDIFFDVIARPPKLVIVGAGHIAVPLARLGSLLDFRVTVLDDRPEFATPERFPDAAEIIVGHYQETLASLPTDRDTYVVLVTRGHVHDTACLEVMLGRCPAYVGMIGSRSRVRTVMRHLAENGHPVGRLREVRAPIGLDLGAQTPAEIALSIMAEIVCVRRGGSGASMALAEKLRV